jgi:hypothetical protein
LGPLAAEQGVPGLAVSTLATGRVWSGRPARAVTQFSPLEWGFGGKYAAEPIFRIAMEG